MTKFSAALRFVAVPLIVAVVAIGCDAGGRPDKQVMPIGKPTVHAPAREKSHRTAAPATGGQP